MPPRPLGTGEGALENYIKVVGEIRDLVNRVSSPEEVESFYGIIRKRYMNPINNYCLNISYRAEDVISSRLVREAQIPYSEYERKAKEGNYGERISEHEERGREQEQGSAKEYNKGVQDGGDRKKPFPFLKPDSTVRTGPEYLSEGVHAGEKEFQTLGIRGGEFGEWVTDEEAQKALDECYVADKLWEEGNRNPYLAVASRNRDLLRDCGGQTYVIPMGDERKQINENFGRMFLELKGLEMLHDRCGVNIDEDLKDRDSDWDFKEKVENQMYEIER